MKTRWLNLVVRLTNRIYTLKEIVLHENGLRVAVHIFGLIFLEIILGAVSLPLYIGLKTATVVGYLETRGGYAAVAIDYKIRRIITLTAVGVMFFLWTIKLIIILAVPNVYGILPLYNVSAIRPAEVAEEALLSTEIGIQTSRVLANMPATDIERVERASGNDYNFYGSGPAGLTAVLLLTDRQTGFYTAPIDAAGHWHITHLHTQFALTEGRHVVVAFGYDPTLKVRGTASPEHFFTVRTTAFDRLLSHLDSIINWSVMVIIAVGIFITFLTV